MATMTPPPDQREENGIPTTVVRDMLLGEDDFENASWDSDVLIQLQDAIVDLRKTQYVKRYGQYLKIVPNFRIRAQDRSGAMMIKKLPGQQAVTRHEYWKHIAKKLRADKKDHESRRALRGNYYPVTYNLQVSVEVSVAVHDVGMYSGLPKRSIMEYGEPKSDMWRDLEDVRKNGCHSTLAQILYDDKADLHLIFPNAGFETNVTALEKLIQQRIDTWFFQSSEYPNNPQIWWPRNRFCEVCKRDGDESTTEDHDQPRKKKRIENWAQEVESDQSSIAKKKRNPNREPQTGKRTQLSMKIRKLERKLKRAKAELARVDEAAEDLDMSDWFDDWKVSG